MRQSLFILATSSGIAFAALDTIFPFSPGFDIQRVAALAESLPSHSWEFGTATEALLELYNTSLSVFGCRAFSAPTVSNVTVPSLSYASQKIVFGEGANQLADGDGAVGDPASLGVGAFMLGKTKPEYQSAAKRELEYLVNEAPRWSNGAISHRVEAPELWADFVYMAPPFIAYYGATTNNFTLLQESVDQCDHYREVLRKGTGQSANLWKHIVGPNNPDAGLWSTGNAWAAAGMTRVLATVVHAPLSLVSSESWRNNAVQKLSSWIGEILDGAIDAPKDEGLLRNYLDDTSDDGHGYGEISGSSLLAAVAYRMAVLQPQTFGRRYIDFANDIRETLGRDGHVQRNGTVTPSVNPLNWGDTIPFTSGSPEGQNFVVLLYSAWRDCVVNGRCSKPEGFTGDLNKLKEKCN